MQELGFPRLYEDGTLTICRAIKGVHRPKSTGGRALGKKKKSFELNSRKKRLIRSSAIRQYITKKRGVLFCTLTFPKLVSQKYANQCFSKFVENLTKNYALKSYIAIKENHKTGNPHFHCLFDIPYTDYKLLNKAWNATFRNRFRFSRNAFTTGRNPIIQNVRQVASYITKYISKTENIPFPELINNDITPEETKKYIKSLQAYNELISTRIYFISENVLSKPQLISENNLIYLLSKYEYTFVFNDNYSIYFLKNFMDLPEKYEISLNKKPKKPKKIPDAMPINIDF